jgi:uncharacterized protein YbbC (DUF1343 family)
MNTPIQPGISALLTQRRDLLAGRRVALLTGPSGILPDLRSSAEALAAVADVRAFFAPEHGLLGALPEAAFVADDTTATGVPIFSLYGDQDAPTPDQLAGIDLVVCDLQDIGCRFYTYAWTLVKLMVVAAQCGVAVLISDRPNPRGGVQVLGPGVASDHQSLIGWHDVPICHGLTLGELALLVNTERQIGCDMTVVPCTGWQRDMRWAETGLPWAAPSPHMPSAELTLIYPGTCLAEGVNLSVGRGTARPFEWIGAPWVRGAELAAALNDQALPGVRWRGIAFQPALAPYAGEICQGVQPYITDHTQYNPLLAGVALLTTLRDTYSAFAISTADGMYADPAQMTRRGYNAATWQAAHFDRLAGSPALREALQAGASATAIIASWQTYETTFHQRRQPYLLYPTGRA